MCLWFILVVCVFVFHFFFAFLSFPWFWDAERYKPCFRLLFCLILSIIIVVFLCISTFSCFFSPVFFYCASHMIAIEFVYKIRACVYAFLCSTHTHLMENVTKWHFNTDFNKLQYHYPIQFVLSSAWRIGISTRSIYYTYVVYSWNA